MLFLLFCVGYYIIAYFERMLCLCNQTYIKNKQSCKECPFLNRDIFLLVYMNSKCFTINRIRAYIHSIACDRKKLYLTSYCIVLISVFAYMLWKWFYSLLFYCSEFCLCLHGFFKLVI